MNVTPEKLHELLTYCNDFAETMLKDSQEFYPFGAVLGGDQKVAAVGAHLGEEHPNPSELYKLLLDTFREQATNGEIIAAAIASNVDIPGNYEPSYPDGVRVQLECINYARFIYTPYSVSEKGFLKKSIEINFLEPFAVEISPQIFSGAESA